MERSVCLFFFFKQKTAYDMRISDWSSDVCSSDLRSFIQHVASRLEIEGHGGKRLIEFVSQCRGHCTHRAQSGDVDQFGLEFLELELVLLFGGEIADRSEEHTSELQSLMRISYAVFCLKKKNHTRTTIHYLTIP